MLIIKELLLKPFVCLDLSLHGGTRFLLLLDKHQKLRRADRLLVVAVAEERLLTREQAPVQLHVLLRQPCR